MDPMAERAGQDELQSQLWRRAYAIFESALEKPEADRDSYAREQVTGDPSLLGIVLELLHNASEEEELVDAAEPAVRAGARIGRYEILYKLGRGGAGDVFAARDTELGRVVALKFLSQSAGSAGRNRLIREAKAASALNHPNVVTVYDVVRQGSDTAIAMELVEGQSLREFCDRPQPAAEVAHWGRQIAEALAATHARGIVHRDIKPENVMVRPDSVVKVLDFGLAREVSMSPGSMATMNLAGTLKYMSPEQTRGESPSAASDIFALGTVLYELLGGRHPFESPSPIDTAYAIAHREPKRLEAPDDLRGLIEDMMAKEPSQRPSAVEVSRRLASLDHSAVRWRVPWKWRIAGAIVVLLPAALWTMRTSLFPPAPLVLEPVTRLADRNVTAAAISPDGSQLAYALIGGPLYLRQLSSGATSILPAPEDLRASRIVWFDDGKRLLVSGKAGPAAQASLWIVPAVSTTGGVALVPARGVDGAPSSDGKLIAFESSDGNSVSIVDADGNHTRVVRSAGPNATFHSLVWSPDGKRVSYMVLSDVAQPPAKYSFEFETADIETGSVVARLDGMPMYSATALPDGRIVCLPWAYPAVSHGGELIEIRTNPSTGAIAGQSRRPMPYSMEAGFSSLSVSRDGSAMALIAASGFDNIVVADFSNTPKPSIGNVRRQTFERAQDFPHSWTTDSKAILFESDRSGQFNLYRLDLDARKETMLYASPSGAVLPKATPDGRWILFRGNSARGAAQLMRIPSTGGQTAVAVPTGGTKDGEQECGLRPGARCVLRSTEADQFVVRELDPVRGIGRVLARSPYGPYLIFDWGLSPDGSTVASPNHDATSAVIRLTPLDAAAGLEEKSITLEGMRNLSAATWSADGQGLFVSANSGTGGVVAYVGLDGRTTTLFESSKATFVVPSPDGKHIAYPDRVVASNVQMLKSPGK